MKARVITINDKLQQNAKFTLAETCPLLEKLSFHACRYQSYNAHIGASIDVPCQHAKQFTEHHVICTYGADTPAREAQFGIPTVSHAPSAQDDHDGSTLD